MKKNVMISLSVLSVFILMSFGTVFQDGPKPTVEWKKTEHDFGKIVQGTPVETKFELKNTSMVPLVITKVKSTCGCTVPNYPKEPVKPGETASITVTFNAASIGAFSKGITVNTNAVEPVQMLYIKGQVVPKSESE